MSCEHNCSCEASTNQSINIKEAVKQKYGGVAALNLESQNSAYREGTNIVAESFGYSKQELENIPSASNMGLSCGNPIAIASLKEGEVVVDLGSGGGIDCFLASKKVGATGKVVGVDMTPTMIELANKNKTKMGNADNVEFKLGEIENLPIEDNFADVVISNCVINLVPDKVKAYQEIYRILKPGGRVAISDICLKKELPSAIRSNVEVLTGCIAGALLSSDLSNIMQTVGFKFVDYIDAKSDLNVYSMVPVQSSGCCGDGACGDNSSSSCGVVYSNETMDQLKNININDYAGSFKIFAVKPFQSNAACSGCDCDGAC